MHESAAEQPHHQNSETQGTFRREARHHPSRFSSCPCPISGRGAPPAGKPRSSPNETTASEPANTSTRIQLMRALHRTTNRGPDAKNPENGFHDV